MRPTAACQRVFCDRYVLRMVHLIRIYNQLRRVLQRAQRESVAAPLQPQRPV